MSVDDELTPEEENAAYLRAHPAHELSLWQDWVLTVCVWKKISVPTGAEWDALTGRWSHGKMPVTSVDELVAMRLAALGEPNR